MAINRQDYQYIRNTIPGQQNQISDGSLGIGSKVTNLLLELKEENIFNPNYTLYYGTLEENNNDKKWTTHSTTSETIQKGFLSKTVTLEADSTYVLQIVGSTKPKAPELPLNSIKITGEDAVEFNQYLFFNTNKNKECTLNLYGLSVGYKILGIEGSEVVQLRSFISPVQAKVYLFKTNLPWIVDNTGTIVGLSESALTTFSSGSSPLKSTYTLEEAKKLFSKKPDVLNTASSVQVLLPEVPNARRAILTTRWTHFNNWSILDKEDQEKIRLIAIRDSLVLSDKEYAAGDYEHTETMRRGILRTLQKTRKSGSDLYSNIDLDKFPDRKIKIQIMPSKLELDSSSLYVSFEWNNDEEIVIKSSDVASYSLSLFSLFGYNYKYCYNNNFLTDNIILKDLAYKYTSICFAWGLVEKDKNGNEYISEILSGYSEPIIIDRNAATISWDSNTESYIIKSEECNVSYQANNNYKTTAVYVLKK